MGVDGATLVYDKGNLSRANQAPVDEAQASYVSSLPPHHFPDLLAIPLSEFKTIEKGTLTGFSYKAQQRQIWGAGCTVVQSYSPGLAAGQDAGVHQHMDKALVKLKALKDSLRRRQQPGVPRSQAHGRGNWQGSQCSASSTASAPPAEGCPHQGRGTLRPRL